MGNLFSCTDVYDTNDMGKIVCDNTMNELSSQLENNDSNLKLRFINNCNYQSCRISTKHVKEDCLQKYSVHCSSSASLNQQHIKLKRCISKQKNKDICTCLISEYNTNDMGITKQKEIKKETDLLHLNMSNQNPYDLQCLCYTMNSTIPYTKTNQTFSETESTNFNCPHIIKSICKNSIPNEHSKNDYSDTLHEIINTILQFDSTTLKLNHTLSSDKKQIPKEDQIKLLQEKTNSFTVSTLSNTPKNLSRSILKIITNTSTHTKHIHRTNKSERFDIKENNTSAFADNAVAHAMYMRNFDGRKMVLSNEKEISMKNSFICCDWNESGIAMLLASIFFIATIIVFYTQYIGFKKQKEFKKCKRMERENAVMEMLLKQFDDYPRDFIEEVNENNHEDHDDDEDEDEDEEEEEDYIDQENADDYEPNEESNIK